MSTPEKTSFNVDKEITSSREGKSQKLKSVTLNTSPLIWDRKVPHTILEDFRKKLSAKHNIKLENYWDLHKWSVENFEKFWEEVWCYFNFKTSRSYDAVFRRTGEGFLDVEWFPGLLFNSAEAMLKTKNSTTAIIYSDETGYEERVTFDEMYEEVKLYAAAFRKNGLKKGDVVACFMSNRKETIFAYIATVSIGAIFGGPQPYLGAKAASNIIQRMEPKFLISIDHHLDNGVWFNNIDYLQEIASNTPSLEKVIIVPTRSETYTRNISDIRNSCLLRDFLMTGMQPDGTVPDIIFEQLPFSHPVALNFTSGTTGLPKGPVHSAGTIVSESVSICFYWNLKPGDVLLSCYPQGWTVWNNLLHCLSHGITFFLYGGNPCYIRKNQNIWDICAQYKATYLLLITSMVDKLEKMNVIPDPSSNLDSLKYVIIGGSPVKAQNCLYIKNKVKEDVFVCSQYGATESFGSFSGIDVNLPCYAGENQIPGLGMNLHCFNSEGKSVVNERGEMVLLTPNVTLPIYLWKDENNEIIKEAYLSKFPGAWCQNDEIWINPETRGIKVIGRSDDTLKQYGERFGATDIYFAIHDMKEIQDYICVGQTRSDGENRAVLFIKMKPGNEFTPEYRQKVEQKILDELWADCVPQLILEAKDIPYNQSNKRMESTVRKIIATNVVPDISNIRNPECLSGFCNIPEVIDFMNCS